MIAEETDWLDLLPDRPPPRPGATGQARVLIVDGGQARAGRDTVATEEPLEIRLISEGRVVSSIVTMRTPGSDFDLAAGLLAAEQLLTHADQLQRITYCVDQAMPDTQRYNVVNVELRPGVSLSIEPRERTLSMTSACGLCGAANLEALHTRGCRPASAGPRVTPDLVLALPEAMRERQRLFASTGGVHAAALFDGEGRHLAGREDVGRHNAVDKVIGWALLERRLPLEQHILMVSSRASYEIMQKALVAGIPIVCSISAPSSLAIALAEDFGITLIGFMRGSRFNVYSGAERLDL